MDLAEFAEKYIKENNLKLLPHHKNMLKAMEAGKMIYYPPRSIGVSVLQEVLRAYYQYLNENE